MPSRIIRYPHQLDELTALLGTLKLPLTVSWVKGADRSGEQNALMWIWAGEVAYQMQDREAADVQAEWKLEIGVPIMRADDVEFRDLYDCTIKPLPYGIKIRAMTLPGFFPVTSKMNVRQMCRFMNLVEQRCVERGFELTQPPEDLAKYNARYGG